MSYKSDMEMLRKHCAQRRKNRILLLKISVIALAALILITAISACVTMAVDWLAPNHHEEDDEGGTPTNDRIKPQITGPEGNMALA